MKMRELRSLLTLKSIDSDLADNDLVGHQRFRLFRITTVFAVIVFVVFMVQIAMANASHPIAVLFIVLLFFTVFINYLLLGRHRNTHLAYIVLVFTLFTVLHVVTYYNGGIRNSGMFFLTSIILTTYMLAGNKTGKVMSFLSVLHIIYFYLVSLYTDWANYDLIGEGPELIDIDFLSTGLISVLIVNSQSAYLEGAKEAIVQDIISRTKEVRVKNAELQSKNRELEQFAYVASHDLQEPLRTISGFVEILDKQYKGKLDPNADKYFGYIIQSSDRMKVLIKDLLDYSRIGNAKGVERVDCRIVLENVILDLNKAIDESGTKIIAGDLPVLNGYGTEIKQLFQNLLVNAIKFRKKDLKPEITVSARKQQNGYWEFSFRDNGIGISEEHQERIFIIFQRLHNRSEYEGSGIGLSHCKKIVELHKGRIWVESVPGEGSNFKFTLQEIEKQ